jgi:hypothetical protein
MKRVISAVLFGFIMVVLVSRIAVAQPASQASAGGAQQSVGAASGHGSMMGDGMGMGGMSGMTGMTGMGGMSGMSGMMGMGMMPMMTQMMKQDPKLMGRMMELHGEMMRTMGDALIKRGKELQQGK